MLTIMDPMYQSDNSQTFSLVGGLLRYAQCTHIIRKPITEEVDQQQFELDDVIAASNFSKAVNEFY